MNRGNVAREIGRPEDGPQVMKGPALSPSLVAKLVILAGLWIIPALGVLTLIILPLLAKAPWASLDIYVYLAMFVVLALLVTVGMKRELEFAGFRGS